MEHYETKDLRPYTTRENTSYDSTKREIERYESKVEQIFKDCTKDLKESVDLQQDVVVRQNELLAQLTKKSLEQEMKLAQQESAIEMIIRKLT